MIRLPEIKADHPAVGTPCALCLEPVQAGAEAMIVPVNPCSPEDEAKARKGQTHLAESAVLHWDCVPDEVKAELDA